MQAAKEIGQNGFEFIFAQQAVVHKDACQPVANRFVHEKRGHRGIHAAAESANGALVADLAPRWNAPWIR